MKPMQINELARNLNISARSIRYYEEQGLIAPAKDPNNRYRLFDGKDAARLQTVISLREVGMPVEEIRTLLAELDKGDQNEVLYSLEMQRSMMFAQFVELKNHIESTDRMIECLKKNQSLAWDDIFELTRGLKRLRDLRSNWRDHWNFDGRASTHDDSVFHQPDEWGDHPNYVPALQTIREWVNAHKGEKGLDMGTGTGNLAGMFLEHEIEMRGFDQSKEMLKICRNKFSGYETKLGNFLAIPYLDHTFDFAVTSYALHHLTEDQKRVAFGEMRRVLKPHGRICMVDLMFENGEQRLSYLAQLQEEGNENRIARIRNEHYGDRSAIVQWFEDHGYVTKIQQLAPLLHIIYAVPGKMAY